VNVPQVIHVDTRCYYIRETRLSVEFLWGKRRHPGYQTNIRQERLENQPIYGEYKKATKGMYQDPGGCRSLRLHTVGSFGNYYAQGSL